MDLISLDKGIVRVSLPPHFFMKIQKPVSHSQTEQTQKVKATLKKASRMYEEQFLREMVRAMRKSVVHSKMTKPGFAENLYREQLDDKYVSSWVDRGGTGFGELIYDQLVDKFYPQLKAQKAKPIGPVDLTDRYPGIP